MGQFNKKKIIIKKNFAKQVYSMNVVKSFFELGTHLMNQ